VEEVLAPEECSQNSDIAKIAVLQHPLHHPDWIPVEVVGRQPLIPEEATDLADDMFGLRDFNPARPRSEFDNEIAVERGGELAERGYFEP
jgi:hypothetical protein